MQNSVIWKSARRGVIFQALGMPRAKISVLRGYAKFCAVASMGRMRQYLPVIFLTFMCTLLDQVYLIFQKN